MRNAKFVMRNYLFAFPFVSTGGKFFCEVTNFESVGKSSVANVCNVNRREFLDVLSDVSGTGRPCGNAFGIGGHNRFRRSFAKDA